MFWEVNEANNLSLRLQNQILDEEKEDEIVWKQEKKGKFIVKSFY